jgi:LysM repeat protein
MPFSPYRAVARATLISGVALLSSGCVYQLPGFVMPGSGTPSAELKPLPPKPKSPLPDSQRLGAIEKTADRPDAGGPGVAYSAPPAPPQLVAKPGEKIVTIGPDDTLLSLSRTHGVPVTMLMSSNNLSNLMLTPGQQLRIPAIGTRRS